MTRIGQLNKQREHALPQGEACEAASMGFALFICAANWWLRTPNASNGNNVRNVNSDGSLNNNNANNANGAAPDCVPDCP